MSDAEVTVGRSVITEMVRLAALEIPGVARVARGGPAWRSLPAGPAVITQLSDDRIRIRVWVVARPGQQVGVLASDVRKAIAAAVERLLGLRLESVTVIVDGVGA